MKLKPTLKFNVLFRAEPEGGFTAIVPSLPGCISYGKTLEKSQMMIKDAIEGYLASLQKRNEKIPTDADSFISTLDFAPREYA